VQPILILDHSGKAFKLTNEMFTTYQLHTRPLRLNTLHCCGRLFQEYCVDTQIEQECLAYFRTNDFQKQVENRRGLEDAAANGIPLSEVGTKVILPSLFSGDPRQMWQLYHDAMAIVRSCGKPDLFIMITANPKWDAIMNALLPGQTAQERPDLVARVFRLKLQARLRLITEKYVFGRLVAHVYVVEFQKRGLPHAYPHHPKSIRQASKGTRLRSYGMCRTAGQDTIS